MAKIKNNYIRAGDITYLEISKRDTNEKVYFIIDSEDGSIARRYKWYAMFCPKRRMYYLESSSKIKYHRLITNCHSNLVVDHMDRDTYNNTKENLRVCTVAENNQNRYYPRLHRNPRKTNTGVQYISKTGTCYRVSYQGVRKGFKSLELAKVYLKELKEGLECYYSEKSKENSD